MLVTAITYSGHNDNVPRFTAGRLFLMASPPPFEYRNAKPQIFINCCGMAKRKLKIATASKQPLCDFYSRNFSQYF